MHLVEKAIGSRPQTWGSAVGRVHSWCSACPEVLRSDGPRPCFKRGSSVNGGMKTCHCSKGGSDRARSWSARIGTTWSAPFLVAGLKSRRHGILGIHTRAQLSAKTCKISLEASDQSFDEVDCIANHRSPDHDPLAGTIAAVTASPEVVFVNDALRVCKEMALLEGSGQSVQLVFREMVPVALASCSLPELAAFGKVLEGVPSCCGGRGQVGKHRFCAALKSRDGVLEAILNDQEGCTFRGVWVLYGGAHRV